MQKCLIFNISWILLFVLQVEIPEDACVNRAILEKI